MDERRSFPIPLLMLYHRGPHIGSILLTPLVTIAHAPMDYGTMSNSEQTYGQY
jgi:hypothetical protein